ncbi:Membrane-associated zinc metalloprotease [Cystobacter fuscus DSM 2262]|uniref:Membrane-associated zinc metalloprotease n=1 Tax=Cystobacter fuscus (strain ATCC 25194 / DSM 2262 / NBRC 100088 / M29) TaxID=1242864 RepID=S9P2H7_CYSF2|nr:RIP metalloprotease RseP [Cystobacter fuscus]EPX58630.1 Membrane-associated zinc metalloprotease [Cystobacter fuscus DSM 2262]
MFQDTALFILLLGVLVTVHELGHFLVAKACGVKVIRFSIGFGPKLFAFTKGETEYQVALLPLGGYVKMAGDAPHEELAPEDADRGFLNAAPWKRALIVVAGPVFNLVFPILIYFFVFVGAHEATSTRVGFVDPAMPAAVAGIRPGDRITSVEGEPVRTFEDLREAFVGRFDRPVPVTIERDGQSTTLNVTPRKIVESSAVDSVERGQIGIQPIRKPAVLGVPAGSVAAQAGFKSFDRVLSVNGVNIPDEAALHEQLAKLQGPLEVTVQRSQPVEVGATTGGVPTLATVKLERQPGGDGFSALGAEPSDMYVSSVFPGSVAQKAGLRAGDRLVSFNGEPLRSFNVLAGELSTLKDKPFTLSWRSSTDGQEHTQQLAQTMRTSTDEMGQETSRLELGVRPWLPSSAELLPVDTVVVTLGVGEALREAVVVVPKIVGQMVKVIGGLVSGQVSTKTLGGPVMMYQLASKSAEQGWDSFLHLMAIISINLGVMNLLPIPILDGFHLLSAFWEAIRRRPIPVRVREMANVVGLILLVALMGMAFFNDITR